MTQTTDAEFVGLLREVKQVGIEGTCSVDNPRPKSVCLIMTTDHAHRLASSTIRVAAITPPNLVIVPSIAHPVWQIPDPKTIFVRIHNELNRRRRPPENQQGAGCCIDPSAVIGAEGIRLIQTANGLINMKHMGNVVLGSDVRVGTFSVIHRATLDSTVIGDGTKIGSLCSIGHNTRIGENCILTAQVAIAGSCEIGNGCLFGIGAAVTNKVKICDGVFLAAGSMLISDVDRPGKYIGSPAKYAGEWDGTWQTNR